MSGDSFVYEGYDVDAAQRHVVCRYALGDRRFSEVVTFAPPEAAGSNADTSGAWTSAWDSDALDAAARILFLLAGVSYYKTAAPLVIDLGTTATTEEERAFLRTFYTEGLGEFAYRNGLDLSGLEVLGPDIGERSPVATNLREGRPLVPFGAGVDSIVTVEHVVHHEPGASLFVVSREGDRFAAIEDAAAVSGLPVVRAERRIDPAVLRSNELGFLNGHVPVTAVILAISLVSAVLGGHDAVVMANERSASVPTVWDGDRAINHQWSKGEAFESAFRKLLATTFAPAPEYFSLLRARSELWVAQQFARLDRYHRVFRSCNRAFAIDPLRRLDHWCGECDKCCFVDLVLAPYMDAAELTAVFDGHEPLGNAALSPNFLVLVGAGEGAKPFECVGDEEECRAAAVLAAGRPDRAATAQLQSLAAAVRAATPSWGDAEQRDSTIRRMLAPEGTDFVPPRFAEDAPARQG